MSSFNGNISLKFLAIALFFLLILPQRAECQQSILDSTFTFRAGTVNTGNALEIISRKTGYNFTYDSRLIDQEKKTVMTFRDTKLSVILDSLLKNDSLVFSVIDRYIIISHAEGHPSLPSDSTASEKVKYITGKIIDNETSEPLPFATIALKNKGKGTVTNQNPQEIISRALKSIPMNYGNTPALMTGFYREGVLKKYELQTYSEAILQIYKSAYSGTLYGDQIKIYKSRKIENTDRSDTLAIRLKAGLSTCLDLDGAKNIFDFLAGESMSDYTYRMTDIVTYDDESAYAIEFEQRENVDLPLFQGTIYINTIDYGILNAEFEINPKLIHEMKDSFISTTSHGFNTWPASVKYSVSYRKMNNRYFLNHVRGDLIFTSSQKRKLFNTQFKVFFELAITEVDLSNVTRFDREELAPIHSIFSKTIKNYDPLFWGNQDFLRPEDNLLKALKNMHVNLQEFSK